MPQPSSVQKGEPRGIEHLRGPIEEALGHRVDALADGLLAVFEVPLEFANRGAVEGRFEFLTGDRPIRPCAVERS